MRPFLVPTVGFLLHYYTSCRRGIQKCHSQPWNKQQPRALFFIGHHNNNNDVKFTADNNNLVAVRSSSYYYVDILDYLDDIEREILNNNNEPPATTLQIPLRKENIKPILRTVLGIESKKEFDKLLRQQQLQMETKQMYQFCQSCLVPRLLQSLLQHRNAKESNDISNNLYTLFEEAIHISQTTNRGASSFHRLASGRQYKGNLTAMVLDLVPGLADQYFINATAPIQETQVWRKAINFVVKGRAKNNNNNNDNNQVVVDKKRIDAAKKCVQLFNQMTNKIRRRRNQNNNHFMLKHTAKKAKNNGIQCEQACVQWLLLERHKHISNNNDAHHHHHHHPVAVVVRSNVRINHKSTQTKLLIKNNPKKKDKRLCGKSRTTVLWTNSGRRHNICSELDAAVFEYNDTTTTTTTTTTHNHNIHVNDAAAVKLSEIWEAKTSISPSTIFDLLSNKLPAIQAMLNDQDLTVTINNFDADDDDMIFHNCAIQKRDNDEYLKNNIGGGGEGTSLIIIGLFGMELLLPENAVGQLRSTAVANALSDIDVALQALDKGHVELPRNVLLRDLHQLRTLYRKATNDFEIVVKVVDDPVGSK